MGDVTPQYFTEVDEEYYTILKGRFRAGDTDTFGLFILYINESEQKVEKLAAIASHYSSLYDNDPHLPWFEFEDILVGTKWRGDVMANLTHDLQNYLESSLDMDRGYELFQYVKNLQQTKMESLLESILMKPLADRNIVIDTDSELVSRKTMDSTREERDTKKREMAEKERTSTPLASKDVIDIEMVLAPVSGTPLQDLKSGDVIMVKIVDKTTKGNYYSDLFGAKVNGDIIPLPAEIVEVKKEDDGGYTVLCKLEEEVLGKATETEQVRVKMFDEFLASAQMLESVPTPYNPDRSRSFVLFISVTGGLLFVLLLLFVILWFTNYF